MIATNFWPVLILIIVVGIAAGFILLSRESGDDLLIPYLGVSVLVGSFLLVIALAIWKVFNG